MSQFRREIYLKAKGETMCDVLRSTAPDENSSLTHEDYLLVFHPRTATGHCIARQGMGTWMEQEPMETFYDLNRLLQDKRQYVEEKKKLLKVLKNIHDITKLRGDCGVNAYALNELLRDIAGISADILVGEA